MRLLEVLAGAQVPVWLIVSGHGFRLLEAECGIGDHRRRSRGDGRQLGSVRVFPDMTGARSRPRDPSAPAGMVDLPLFDGHGVRDGDRLAAGRWWSARPT